MSAPRSYSITQSAPVTSKTRPLAQIGAAAILTALCASTYTAAESRWSANTVLADGVPQDILQAYLHDTAFVDGTTRGLFRRDWLLALEVPGPSRNLFWDQREQFGFVNNPDHPEQMPVGFGWAGNYLAANCAACHTSFIEHDGEMLIIPGGANRRAVGGGSQAYYALADTLLQPGSLGRFANRVLGEDHSRADRQALRAEMEDIINVYLSNTFTAVSGMQVEGYAQFHVINTVGGVMSWVRDEAGQFGSHPFIVGQNLWMGAQNFNPVLPTTDIPYIYDLEYLDRLHYNGNTNSVLERNIISLLNTVNPATFDELLLDIDPRQLNAAEQVAAWMPPPAWPEDILGPIDREMAARGEAHYQTYCASCHAVNVTEPLKLTVHAAEEIGTDTAYFDHFQVPMRDIFGQEEMTYGDALATAMTAFKEYWYPLYEVTPEEAVAFDPDPWWDFQPVWTGRPLSGIWSTAPYLHNGSVPTLYHLLLPSDERPVTYTGGSDRFDPEYVGIEWDAEPSLANGTFTYDSSEPGAALSGHDYGTDMTDQMRRELLEYLKTI